MEDKKAGLGQIVQVRQVKDALDLLPNDPSLATVIMKD
jgi:hypothetical protein